MIGEELLFEKKMAKAFKERNGYQVKDLLQAGIDHLASAKVLFEKNPRCYDSAGYLSHLGIERVLKSLLLHFKGEFPGIHPIRKLTRMLEAADCGLSLGKDHGDILLNLDQFSELRYSKPNSPIEIGKEDWKIIQDLFWLLTSLMPKAMGEEVGAIDATRKDGRILMVGKRESWPAG